MRTFSPKKHLCCKVQAAVDVAVSQDIFHCMFPDASDAEHLSFHPFTVNGTEWQRHLTTVSN